MTHTKDEALNRAQSAISYTILALSNGNDLTYAKACLESALTAVKKAQTQTVQEPVWFSLDEVKPIEGQMVLAWYKGFAYPDTAVWLGTKGWAIDSELASPYWDEVQNPITHWMPLPQGPLDLNADPTQNGSSA